MNDESYTKESILTQWQTCVDMANSVSHRRDTTNNLFVTLNIALLAAISFIWETKTVLLSLVGIAICIVWILFINNFRRLNAEKFRVIISMEKHLPVATFSDEWDGLQGTKGYIDGTKLEQSLPSIFILAYLAVIFFVFPGGESNNVQSVYQPLLDLL